MRPLLIRPVCLAGIVFFALSGLLSHADAPPVTTVDGLGRGLVALEGPWQFHLGDNPTYSTQSLNDETGIDGWEEISPDKTWGAQTHPAYTGYAWYRKHLHLTPAPSATADFAMLIRGIDDAYEIYWNGDLVGSNGTMPPHPSFQYHQAAQTFGLGPVRDGVLSIRVWKQALSSFDNDKLGGLYFAPVVGSPESIAARKAQLDYSWLRSRQYSFGLQSLYGLVMLLSLLGWLRDRSQRVLLAMAAFSGAPLVVFFLTGLRLPLSYDFSLGMLQPTLSVADIGLWFLLLYLLKLNENPTLAWFTKLLAIISFTSTSLDGMLAFFNGADPALAGPAQIADAALTGIFTLIELYPLVLIGFAVRKRLDPVRWLVAIMAFLTAMVNVVQTGVAQGSRFTHWTLAEKIGSALFTVNGNVFTASVIATTLLLLSILYAVFRYMQDTASRQNSLEQEFRSARELQKVLVPETLPALPGFAVTSAYKPAKEVGGDFFQIVPLEGKQQGVTLIILGDVSGKGLKAAMTVSLIVGMVRVLADNVTGPAQLLAELNRRLYGRLQGGFATCLALWLRSDGSCILAGAGHPAPFLNQQSLELPGALPVGIAPATEYTEIPLKLREGDHFALYTDGLLEARNHSGEIFSFARLNALFATLPGAEEATQAAVDFGQDDDITVLTLTRLRSGQKSTTQLINLGMLQGIARTSR